MAADVANQPSLKETPMIEKVLAKLQSEIGSLVGQIAFLTVQNQTLAEEVKTLKASYNQAGPSLLTKIDEP